VRRRLGEARLQLEVLAELVVQIGIVRIGREREGEQARVAPALPAFCASR
jgi:hypothetical protein